MLKYIFAFSPMGISLMAWLIAGTCHGWWNVSEWDTGYRFLAGIFMLACLYFSLQGILQIRDHTSDGGGWWNTVDFLMALCIGSSMSIVLTLATDRGIVIIPSCINGSLIGYLLIRRDVIRKRRKS